MRRLCAELAEVGGRRDEAATEVVHPDSIDDDACKERVIFVHEPLREGKASSCRRKRRIVLGKRESAIVAPGDGERRRRNGLLRRPMITAVKQIRHGCVPGGLDECAQELLGGFLLPRARDAGVVLLELRGGLRQVLIEDPGAQVDARILL